VPRCRLYYFADPEDYDVNGVAQPAAKGFLQLSPGTKVRRHTAIMQAVFTGCVSAVSAA